MSDSNESQGLLPFALSVDHAHREVVLSIRGTWSVEDTITDLLWEPAAIATPELIVNPAHTPQGAQTAPSVESMVRRT